MLSPPSLPQALMQRAFRARNGELGIAPGDVEAFLTACATDRIGVLGWELWLIDHVIDGNAGALHASRGDWCGLIPTRDSAEPAVIGGTGDIAETRRQIASLDLDALVAPQWRPHLRFNFTLED